jgi:mannitol-1-/sugar-/sorbitol-6-/2-deoxyglucose-6-phosphatase
MVEAVIFDMDGLLIDSEPLWREAEVSLFNSLGVPLTEEMAHETTGLRTDSLVAYWHKRYPWKTPPQKEVGRLLEESVIKLVKEKGDAKPGVKKVFSIFSDNGLPIAIASSSPMALIETVIDKLGLAPYMSAVGSAHYEDFGKPHPAVYLSTAKKLGAAPENCLAFEDSVNGVLSAKAARMKCIAVPEPEFFEDKRYGIADIILNTLEDFTPRMLNF